MQESFPNNVSFPNQLCNDQHCPFKQILKQVLKKVGQLSMLPELNSLLGSQPASSNPCAPTSAPIVSSVPVSQIDSAHLAHESKQLSNQNRVNLNKPYKAISKIRKIKNQISNNSSIDKRNIDKKSSQSDIDCDHCSVESKSPKETAQRSREKHSFKGKTKEGRNKHRNGPCFIQQSQLQFQRNKHFVQRGVHHGIHPFVFQNIPIETHQHSAAQEKENTGSKDKMEENQDKQEGLHRIKNGVQDDQSAQQRNDVDTEVQTKYLKRPTRRPTSMSDLELQEWFHIFYGDGETQSLILSHKVKNNERLYYLYRNGQFQWSSGLRIQNQLGQGVQLNDYEDSLAMYK